MDLENKEEMTAVEETKAETVETTEEAPAEEKHSRRRGRGKKKIETTEEKPQFEWIERVVQISRSEERR